MSNRLRYVDVHYLSILTFYEILLGSEQSTVLDGNLKNKSMTIPVLLIKAFVVVKFKLYLM